MTKKDFFSVIIKLLGLYLIISTLFSGVVGPIYWNYLDTNGILVFWMILAVILVAILIGLFVLLVFKSNNIVEMLKLEKGFQEDRIDFGNLKKEDIIKIGSFIIGGLLFINNLPSFISHVFIAFKESFNTPLFPTYGQDHFNLIVSGINVILGYLLITRYSFIAKVFLKVDKTKSE